MKVTTKIKIKIDKILKETKRDERSSCAFFLGYIRGVIDCREIVVKAEETQD